MSVAAARLTGSASRRSQENTPALASQRTPSLSKATDAADIGARATSEPVPTSHTVQSSALDPNAMRVRLGDNAMVAMSPCARRLETPSHTGLRNSTANPTPDVTRSAIASWTPKCGDERAFDGPAPD